MVIRAWIERQWARKVDRVDIIFDGSDTVTIAQYPYNDGEKFPIQDARKVLVATYGVSFKKPWGDPYRKEAYDRVQLDHFVLE